VEDVWAARGAPEKKKGPLRLVGDPKTISKDGKNSNAREKSPKGEEKPGQIVKPPGTIYKTRRTLSAPPKASGTEGESGKIALIVGESPYKIPWASKASPNLKGGESAVKSTKQVTVLGLSSSAKKKTPGEAQRVEQAAPRPKRKKDYQSTGAITCTSGTSRKAQNYHRIKPNCVPCHNQTRTELS